MKNISKANKRYHRKNTSNSSGKELILGGGLGVHVRVFKNACNSTMRPKSPTE